jgi:hypothetical protein
VHCMKENSTVNRVRKMANVTIGFVVSVRPHGTTRLPLDEFSLNLLFEYFPKIRRESSSFIKI